MLGHPISKFFAVLLTVFSLSACGSKTEWKSGVYEVYWIDVPSDLTLGLALADGNWIGRVMPQVISVGENSRWMVAARHPGGDKSITEYFYFSRDSDHPHKNADEIVEGPFTEAEFEKKKGELELPDFSKHF